MDIGANVGAASLCFALRYPVARVLAFEPFPDSFALLQANLAQVPNAEAHGVGLYDAECERPMFVGKEDHVTNSVASSYLNGDDSVRVQLRSAATVLRELGVARIDILKIDTEGCEIPILRDLGETALGARVIYLEYHDEDDRLEIDRRLRDTHILYAASVRHPHRGDVCYVRQDAFPSQIKLDALRIRAPADPAGGGGGPADADRVVTRAGGGASRQAPFRVAVVMPTILRPSLRRAVESVFAQDLAGRCQLLIGIDQHAGDRALLDDILAAKPDHWTVSVVDPGYSTSAWHGGVHAARDGGALRTILSYLANSPHLAYLDDDNWWAPGHLRSLLGAISGHDWAYAQRWFVDPESLNPECVDSWESVGPMAGVFKDQFGGFVDPSTLMIDKTRCESVLRWWSVPLSGDPKGMSADRHVFGALSHKSAGRPTGTATCYYVMDPGDDMHPLRLRMIEETRQALPDTR